MARSPLNLYNEVTDGAIASNYRMIRSLKMKNIINIIITFIVITGQVTLLGKDENDLIQTSNV